MPPISESPQTATAIPRGPIPLSDADLSTEQVMDWILDCQADPTRSTAYLGDTGTGAREELEGLDQDWRDTIRLVVDGQVPVAACAVEWDAEPATAWLQGPWGEPAAVRAWGPRLVASLVEQLPEGISTLEFCGDVRNTAMAELAENLGWTPTAASAAMVLPAAAARDLVEATSTREGALTSEAAGVPLLVRVAEENDMEQLRVLHQNAFPEAYATTEQLLTRHLTVVAAQADDPHRVLGYAAGQLQDDGQGYIDFTAVDPTARRRGVGRSLLLALIKQLLQGADPARLDHVHLTVREELAAARALYTALGFATDIIIRGYRGNR